MAEIELYAILFGLGAAVCWGAGDFSGGVATKRSRVLGVAMISQVAGIILLMLSAMAYGEVMPEKGNILWGALAGISGGIGLLALYHSLSVSRMGVVAPVAAVSSAIIPVAFGMLLEGFPAAGRMLGFMFAFTGVWLITKEGNGTRFDLKNLKLPVLAGIGFGLFMIFIDRIEGDAIFWPLVGARIASLTMFAAASLWTSRREIPEAGHLPLIVLAGVFDTGGNVFYALAAHAGRLDVAAILTSMYPAATVLLAWMLLKERLSRSQWLGVFAVLIAVVLIA
jgi:drug/metabolite transporter (DMT)-like permease